MLDPALVCFMIIKAMDARGSPQNDILFQDIDYGLGYGASFNPAGSVPSGYGSLSFAYPIVISTTIKEFPTNVTMNLVYAGTNNTFYTNGVAANAPLNPWSFVGSATKIGGHLSLYGFNGYLKEFIVYTNHAISASQISNLNYYANNYPYTNP